VHIPGSSRGLYRMLPNKIAAPNLRVNRTASCAYGYPLASLVGGRLRVTLAAIAPVTGSFIWSRVVYTRWLLHLQTPQLRVRALKHRCVPSNSFEDDTGVGMVRRTGTADPPGRNLRSLDRSVRDAEACRLTWCRREGVTFRVLILKILQLLFGR
jgi:hypothetical protein